MSPEPAKKTGKPITDLAAAALDELRASSLTCPTCGQGRDEHTVPLNYGATVECADVFHREER